MNLNIFSFIITEGVAAALAVIVLLLAAALSYIVFRLLRKSLKMVFRLIVAIGILFIGLAGAGVFWWMSSSSETPKRPSAPANRKR